jgi:hypothetical protein
MVSTHRQRKRINRTTGQHHYRIVPITAAYCGMVSVFKIARRIEQLNGPKSLTFFTEKFRIQKLVIINTI